MLVSEEFFKSIIKILKRNYVIFTKRNTETYQKEKRFL